MALAVVLGAAGHALVWFSPGIRYIAPSLPAGGVLVRHDVRAWSESSFVDIVVAVVLLGAALSATRLAANIAVRRVWLHCLVAGVLGLALTFLGMLRAGDYERDVLPASALPVPGLHVQTARHPQAGVYLWMASAVVCLVASALAYRVSRTGSGREA